VIKQKQDQGSYFIGISEIGESHKRNGKPNQDSIEFDVIGKTIFLAVSDGLGSCELSHIGSKQAISFCRDIVIKIENNEIEFSTKEISRYFAKLWNARFSKTESKKYCATLKAIFVRNDTAITLSIGDGVLMLISGETLYLSDETISDFVNETKCLNYGIKDIDLNAFSHEIFDKLFVFACTDGVSTSIEEKKRNAFLKAASEIEDNNELQKVLVELTEEISKYNSDDKTIGVIKI
jgi:hypothetical protein